MGGFPFHAHAKANGTPRQRQRKGEKEKSEVSDALRRPFGASLEAQFNMQVCGSHPGEGFRRHTKQKLAEVYTKAVLRVP